MVSLQIILLISFVTVITAIPFSPEPAIETTAPTAPTVLISTPPPLCGESCAFRLCRRNTDGSASAIGKRIIVNSAPIPVICNRKLPSLVAVNTGKPLIFQEGEYINLQRFFLENGLGNVGPKAFTDASLRKSVHRRFGTDKGISSNFNAVQYLTLKNACIVLPVVSYEQEHERNGIIERTDKVHLGRPLIDCVSFTTSAPRMHIEFIWTVASDNFDIEVQEPSGIIVNAATKRSGGNGNHVKDIGVAKCGFITHARESIVYEDAAEAGTYVIRVKNAGRCAKTSVKHHRFALYVLRVFVDGQVIYKTNGRAIGKDFTEEYEVELKTALM